MPGYLFYKIKKMDACREGTYAPIEYETDSPEKAIGTRSPASGIRFGAHTIVKVCGAPVDKASYR